MLADPSFAERLSGEALQPMPMTPAQFGQYMRDDIAKWTKVAKERNIELTRLTWPTTRKVAADTNAPPVTRILAEFVAEPSVRGVSRRAWSARRIARS